MKLIILHSGKWSPIQWVPLILSINFHLPKRLTEDFWSCMEHRVGPHCFTHACCCILLASWKKTNLTIWKIFLVVDFLCLKKKKKIHYKMKVESRKILNFYIFFCRNLVFYILGLRFSVNVTNLSFLLKVNLS